MDNHEQLLAAWELQDESALNHLNCIHLMLHLLVEGPNAALIFSQIEVASAVHSKLTTSVTMVNSPCIATARTLTYSTACAP